MKLGYFEMMLQIQNYLNQMPNLTVKMLKKNQKRRKKKSLKPRRLLKKKVYH